MNIKKQITSRLHFIMKSLDAARKSQYENRKASLEASLLARSNMGVSKQLYCDNTELIVSLTSYGPRIQDVHLTIESMMQQTRKANRIILWLSENEQTKELPMSLQLQQERGLEVRHCTDIRSYTKLIPTLKLCPEAIIITVDDDCLYNVDVIDRLYRSYITDKTCVHCLTGSEIAINDGEIEPYCKWKPFKINASGKKYLATGVGGVIYPPHIFTSEVFNENVFMSICPTADDIWFKTMELIAGVKVKRAEVHNASGVEFMTNEVAQVVNLNSNNVRGGQNDVQIKKVFERYGITAESILE
mgnify:CR=1 FL=1